MSDDIVPPVPPPEYAPEPGPFDKREPVRVRLSFYLISVFLVAVVVFVVMLALYFPGYQNYARIAVAVKGADYVYMGIRIPEKLLADRNLTYKKASEIAEILTKDMGAKRARAQINPDKVTLPFER